MQGEAATPRGGYGATGIGEATFQIDPDSGQLIIRADEETNRQIQEVLRNLDQPVPQVLIKVLFLEVTHTDGYDIGAEMSFQSGSESIRSDPQTNVTNTRSVVDGVVSTDYSRTTEYTESLVAKNVLETIFGVATQGAFYRLMDDDLQMTLYALSQVAKLEVLSRPSILARNYEPAIITLGQEVPFIRNSRVTDNGQIINTVEYEDIGIILQVTPRITKTGLVEMYVAPEISTLSGETVQVSDNVEAPIIAKRAAETMVVVPDGMTIVIGGLMEDNETELVRKVPILGDIPWLGAIFRRKIHDKTKTELLIFLTPHVVQTSSNLLAMSATETQKAHLAPTAFTTDELDRHLDNHEVLIAPPPEEEKRSVFVRTGQWLRKQVQIFR
jgi:general secretion pathway protein D